MAKKIKTIVKLNLPAGEATPAPPVGPALGQHGINIVEFCRSYNEKTANEKGQLIPAEITIFEDRTFTFVTKTPPASDLLRKAVGKEKGSDAPNRNKIGKITKEQARQIATLKMKDLNAKDIEAAVKIVAGTARSMGIEIE